MTDEELQALFNQADQAADEVYATEVSNLLRLTKAEVEAIVQEAGVDKKKLAELIKVVKDTTQSNQQKAILIKNATGLAEVAVEIVKTLT